MSYLKNKIPKSVTNLVQTLSEDKIISISKAAVINYLNQYLEVDGTLREISKKIGSSSLQYITNLKVPTDPKGNKDESYHQTLISKYTEELKMQIPAILLADDGYKWTPAGLSSSQVIGYDDDGDPIHKFTFLFDINLTLSVVTNDEESTKQLMTFIVLCLGPFQELGGGSRLTACNEPESSIVIMLPPTIDPPSFDRVQIQGEEVDHFWAGKVNLPISYESSVKITVRQDKVTSIRGVVDTDLSKVLPYTNLNRDLQLGEEFIIRFSQMEPDDKAYIVCEDRSVVWQKQDPTHIKVTASRVGTFKVQVVSGNRNKENIKFTQDFNVVY